MLSPLSTQPIFKNGTLAYGAKACVYDAGTTTPRALYRTADLDPTRQWPNPLPVGSDGTMPVVYVGVGDYDVYLKDANDAQFRVVLGLPGDPAPDTSAGDTFDPLRQLPTGALVMMAAAGRMNGFVRANGLRIGSAASDADERNAQDTLALFTLLWNQGGAVVGGRGASADADFSANRTIALPNLQNRALVGITDMGNAGGAASLAGSGVASITVGGTGGEAGHTLSAVEMPVHGHDAAFTGQAVPSHSHTATAQSLPDHVHGVPQPSAINGVAKGGTDITGLWYGAQNLQTGSAGGHTPSVSIGNAGGFTPEGSVTIQNAGSGAAHPNMQPFLGLMAHLKL